MTYDETKDKVVFLSLGSNLGNRKQNILEAVKYLEISLNQKITISPLYESEALGFESDLRFLNICARTITHLSPHELLKLIQEVEYDLGRIRTKNNEYIDRSIDIDILFYDNVILNSKNLTIPHPELYHRKFVLIPLLDVAKNLIDPMSKKDIETILGECNDKSNLILYEN